MSGENRPEARGVVIELFPSKKDWTKEIRGGTLSFNLTVILNYHNNNIDKFPYIGVGFSLMYMDKSKKKEIEHILTGAQKIRLEFTPVSATEGLSQFSLDLPFDGFTELSHADIGELFSGNCTFTWRDFSDSDFNTAKQYKKEEKLTPETIKKNFRVRMSLVVGGQTHCFLDSNNSGHCINIY